MTTLTVQMFLPSQDDALCEIEISDRIESAFNLETGEEIDPATIPQEELDTMTAFAMGERNRGKEMMIFDWDKAAELIRERNPESASAGLSGDWEWTGGEIFRGGQIVEDSYTYLGSTWATPLLDLDGEQIECYRMQSKTPGWDTDTKWPESARSIIGTESRGKVEAMSRATEAERQEHIYALRQQGIEFEREYERAKTKIALRFKVSRDTAADILFFIMDDNIQFLQRKPETFP